MIFEELTLTDFRQFAGTQTITFAKDPTRNVTVIHGFNGSGKTTLLNAFTWLLYGEFSPDFEGTDRLETEASFAPLLPGQKMETRVRASFRDGERRFTAVRTMIVEKDRNGVRRVVEPGRLTLLFIDENGETQEPRNPQDMLERMLPKRLHPFFFFNGERIERLARADAYEEIGEGVRTLLDIELFDRSVRHLDGEVSRRLRTDIAQHAGQEGEQAQRDLEALNARRDEIEGKIQQLVRNHAGLEAEREAIDARLASMPELAKLQAQRKAAEEREAVIIRDMKERKQELARQFSRNGYVLLVPDVLRTAKEILEGARGQIPGPIKRQFVQDLLEERRCICGRELLPETEEYRKVEEWRKRALSDDLESVVSVTRARIGSFDERAETCVTEIGRLQSIRDQLSTELRRVQEEQSELSLKIGNRDQGEDPDRLERRRREIADQITTLRMDTEMTKRDAERVEQEIQEKQREIRYLQRADEEGQRAQQRLDAVSNVVTALRQIRTIRFEDLRGDLSDILGRVWSGIAIKDYRAQLDADFRLRLTKEVAGSEEPVKGASTGEKQVLSLAFVGALSAKARQTFDEARQDQDLFRGGLYPLIVDSAFGSLEVEYRRDVAKWIPSLSPQVVLMLSETQFRQEVEQELLPRIGAEWILRCETPKNAARSISLRGRAYPYVVQSADGFERTTFLEVQQ